jgi:hypothetical protein
MSTSRDFTDKNTKFTGSDGIVIPVGTTSGTGPRPGSPDVGTLRYNTTNGLAEFYTAGGWTPIDSPPAVTTLTGIINENTDSTITISGTGFKVGAVVSIIGAGVSGIPRTLATTFVNATQITAATNAAAVNYVGGALFDVQVTNTSGLAGVLSAAASIDRDPLWSTGAGSLGTVTDANRSSASFSLSASDPDGTTIVYSIVSGGIPAGASFNTSSGAITGPFSAVATSTTSSFTVRAAANGQNVDRAFSIIVSAPVITFSTASGSLGIIYDSTRSGYSLSSAAATVTSGTLSYSIVSGSVPSGLSFNTSTGAITGTANAVGSDTTSNFTVRATTTSASATADRAFSITVRSPVVTSFTSTGSSSFSVPTGVTSIQVLVVAGGAGGGYGNSNEGGGGGGAGGVVYSSSYPVSPGGSSPLNVGGGTAAADSPGGAPSGGNSAGPSTFGTMTANGGGAGGYGQAGFTGGSGGGGSGFGSDWPGGSANQGPQPNGGTGYGNPGGTGKWTSGKNGAAGGGGGAGGRGDDGPDGGNPGGNGGGGVSISITGSSISYGAGGNGGYGRNAGGPSITGTTNRGNGGTGGNPSGGMAPGGPGVVIVRY